MRIYDVILKKRNGGTLTKEEIAYFIDGYVDGSIPDYQAAALCMAIWFRGMSDEETAALTDCMARSGDTVDLSAFGTLTVDKHSTGGATRADIRLFSEHLTNGKRIKAAGGIASLRDAEDFIALGAERLGTSRIVRIVKSQEE